MVIWAVDRTICVMVSDPWASAVIHAAAIAPMRIIIIVTAEHGSHRDARSERYYQTRCRLCGRRRNIHLHRIVLWHVDYLRVCRLNHNHLLGARLLRNYCLLRSGLQIAGLFRLEPKPLDRVEDRALARSEGSAELLGPIDLRTHHVDDLREVKQSDHGRSKSCTLRSGVELGTF